MLHVFSVKILRLVEWFLFYLTFFYPPKIFFFKIVCKVYQKKRNFALISKMCTNVFSLEKGEKIKEKLIFFQLL
jgi:hypothetical protein